MWQRIVGAMLVAVTTWGIPATRTHADNSPYLNVWVHYDYMVGPGYSDAPSAAAMQMVVDAFKAHGVTLTIDPQHAAIPARKVIVPDWQSRYASAPGFDDPSCTGPDAVRFSDLKNQYFHPNSNHPWHYVIFADYLFSDSAAHVVNCPATVENNNQPPFFGMVGFSQVGFEDVSGGLGYNFVVAPGVWRDSGFRPTDVNVAAIFMHELGHNFGLGHGGVPNSYNGQWGLNDKPNYLSVMNYNFEYGIPYAATPGSTTIAGYRADYSDVKLPDLHEACLDETAGIQDTVHPTDITSWTLNGADFYSASASSPTIDWNQDGNATERCVAADIDGDDFGGLRPKTLSGSDDWAWIHARLTPPTITSVDNHRSYIAGEDLGILGPNLMAPATVIFAGGASAPASEFGSVVSSSGDVTPTGLSVTVPPRARSGPVTVVTPDGSATSSQSVTIVKTPLAITAGSDGNLWFTDTGGNIGRIKPSGAIKEFPLPSSGSTPEGITAGPDGNLWFTDSQDKIGRITPSGTITEFSLPSYDCSPETGGGTAFPTAIAAGSDGNLWFGWSCLQQIGRITPSGVVTDFALGFPVAWAPYNFAQEITAGPDGNLWIAEANGAVSLARMTTSGAVTEFPLLDRGYVGGITNSPDGNLWFTEYGTSVGPEIGRITTSGAVTEFPVPSGSDPLGGITAGPDGNVWFSDSRANAIGRVTPTGAMTEFSLPSRGFPLAIAAGTDGNLWFTEEASGKMGRITPSGTITEFPLP